MTIDPVIEPDALRGRQFRLLEAAAPEGVGRADITSPTGYYMQGWVPSDAVLFPKSSQAARCRSAPSPPTRRQDRLEPIFPKRLPRRFRIAADMRR